MKQWTLVTHFICIWFFLPLCTSAENTLVFPTNDWQTASPESQGVEPAALRKAMEYLHEHSNGVGTDETVVIRNGYLIWKGSHADTVHELYSCTKTFTGTVMGLLAADGLLDVDDYAVEYLPSLDDPYPEYARIRLSHLASMTSGYDGAMGDGWKFYQTDRETHHKHVMAYTTPGPPMFLAGTSFKYHDPQVHLLGYLLTKLANDSLEYVFQTRIADPIGMKRFSWSNYGSRDGLLFNNPAGTPGEDQGGIYTNALDAARYGWFYLNRGNWNGKQILDPSFVDRATTSQVSVEIQTKYMDLTGRYGFYWWTNGVQKNGKRPWPSAPPKSYAAHGAGRNFIFVIPEWNMVIVRLSTAPGGNLQTGSMKESVWEEFFQRLKMAL